MGEIGRVEIRNDILIIYCSAIVGKLAAERDTPMAVDADSLAGKGLATRTRHIVAGSRRE